MFTENRTAKFPLQQEIMDFKHYRHTGDKKSQLPQTVSRFPVKSPIVTYKSVSLNLHTE